MSTRCMVELRDQFTKKQGVLLYHHSGGYPEFQLGKLTRFLVSVKNFLDEAGYPYWWDDERVAAVMVLLSARTYKDAALLGNEAMDEWVKARADADKSGDHVTLLDNPARLTNNGVPVYQPAAEYHGDIEYLYEVTLTGQGEYEIKVFKCDFDGDVRGKEITDEAYKQAGIKRKEVSDA